MKQPVTRRRFVVPAANRPQKILYTAAIVRKLGRTLRSVGICFAQEPFREKTPYLDRVDCPDRAGRGHWGSGDGLLAVSQRVRHDSSCFATPGYPRGPRCRAAIPSMPSTYLFSTRSGSPVRAGDLGRGSAPIVSVLGWASSCGLQARRQRPMLAVSVRRLDLRECRAFAYLVASILVPRTIERFAAAPVACTRPLSPGDRGLHRSRPARRADQEHGPDARTGPSPGALPLLGGWLNEKLCGSRSRSCPAGVRIPQSERSPAPAS